MNFDFTEEQSMLKESVERLIADEYDFEQRKKHMKEPGGWNRKLWEHYGEMGLLALPFSEEDGGIGGGPVEVGVVMETFGKGLVLEPYVATVLLAGGALRMGGSADQRATLIPRIADGSLLMAFAHQEEQARYNLASVATTARRDGDGWSIDGVKNFVVHGDCAQKLIVSARVSGSVTDRDGLALFIIDAAAPGVTVTGYPTQDDQRAARIALKNVRVTGDAVLGEAGKALPLIERVADAALAALCAEAVGGMAVVLDTTVEYLKTRKQFGVTIGSFQALQHRAADMFVALEQARSMMTYAIMMAEEPDAAERAKALSAAKVQIGKSMRFIGQNGIQLHGGIGVTEELKVGHYFRRFTMIEYAFGDTDFHLTRLAEAGGLVAPGGVA